MHKKVIYRSSRTGQMVTEQFAKSHPATTERQHVPVKGSKK
jgi:hypothetical protein